MEEYLTTIELSERIKMAPGTIRNLVWKKELKQNIHYLKPTSRKLLFIWTEVQKWLYRDTTNSSQPDNYPKGLINI